MENALTTLRKIWVIRLPEPHISCPAHLPAMALLLPTSPSPRDMSQVLGMPGAAPAGNSWQSRAQVAGEIRPQQEVCFEGRGAVSLMPPHLASWAHPAPGCQSHGPAGWKLGEHEVQGDHIAHFRGRPICGVFWMWLPAAVWGGLATVVPMHRKLHRGWGSPHSLEPGGDVRSEPGTSSSIIQLSQANTVGKGDRDQG